MRHYNIESVGGITFSPGGGELSDFADGVDNALAKYDGVNSIQDTGVIVDDSNNVSGINDLSIGGNLFIDGTTFVVHSGEVSTSDAVVYINDGEVGPGVTAGQAGIQVDRGSETDYQFMFVEATDAFEVGEVGSLQAVATREDAPINNYVPYWNDTDKRFDTAGSIPITSISIPTGTKMWFYADAAPSGWTIDATPSDNILAVKGGATYTTGGVQVGSWTVSGLTSNNESSHTHLVSGTTAAEAQTPVEQGSNSNDAAHEDHTHTMSFTSGAGSAHNHTVTQDATWRPKANVGIICTKD